MRLHRTFLLSTALAVLVGAVGCSSNTQGDDASPVFLEVDFTLLPLAQNVASGSYLQFQTVTLKSILKNPTAGCSPFLDTRLDRYTIVWSRTDGGKTASATESYPGNLTVPCGGNSVLNNYEFMSPASLLRPPLDQLFPYNGGIDRETGNTTIRQRGTVTFEGHTMSGQPVSGVNGFGMNFYYAATAVRPGLSSLRLRPMAPR